MRLREVGGHATRAVHAGLADLVVRRALVLAAEHLVRFGHLVRVRLKLMIRVRVRVGVRLRVRVRVSTLPTLS